MTTLITIALLGLFDPVKDDARPAATASAAQEGSAVRPALPTAADSVVAAAFGKNIDTGVNDLKPEATTSVDWTNLAAPGLALIGLAALAVALAKRRRTVGSNIRIVESAALGPRRSLVIADVLGERLVLAVSEAGVSVLTTRPAPEPTQEPEFFVVPDVQPVKRTLPTMGFFARVFGRTPAPQRFDDLLGESIEDQELRAKLAAGMKGYVP